MQRPHLVIRCVGGGFEWVGCVSARARERKRKNHSVPRVEHPGTLYRDIKATDRLAGLFRQQYRPALGDVARSARSVNSKHNWMSQLDFADHSDQRSHGSARTAATHRTKPKFRENARDIFSVKAAADHDGSLCAFEPKSGKNNATMPETPDAIAPARPTPHTLRFADY